MGIEHIDITDHKRLGSGQSSYISYTIDVKFADADLELIKIHRRYNDFKWLYNSLRDELPAHIIPPLAKDKYTSLISQDRFSEDFISFRKKYLTTFLRMIVGSKALCKSSSFRIFLVCIDPPHLSAPAIAEKDSSFMNLAASLISKIYHKNIDLPTEIKDVKAIVKGKCITFDIMSSSQASFEKHHRYVERCSSLVATEFSGLAELALDVVLPKLNRPPNMEMSLASELSIFSGILSAELKALSYVKEVACACADLSLYRTKLSKERRDAILMKPKPLLSAMLSPSFYKGSKSSGVPSDQKSRILDTELKLAEVEDALQKGSVEFSNALSTVLSEDRIAAAYIASSLKSSIQAYCSFMIDSHESLLGYWNSVVDILDSSPTS